MSDFLFVQSQDPFTDVRASRQYDLATRLARSGSNVRVLLVQNGVSPARKGADCPAFDALLATNVTVLADDVALRQREFTAEQLRDGVQPAEIGVVVDAMLAGHKVIWN
jgi:sulfur relay (sulfurtransferase) complex TusBCD TusD component (DsrE family)